MNERLPAFGALICAAGSSSRMGGIKKEFQILPESTRPMTTVLGAAVSVFASIREIGPILVAIPQGMEDAARASLPAALAGRIEFVAGGKSRQESVHRALQALQAHMPAYVLIHDGARPWISADVVLRIMDKVREYGAAIPILPLVETPKEIDESGMILRHLPRSRVGTAQTPQGFPFPAILHAHEKAALREGIEYTDDAESGPNLKAR